MHVITAEHLHAAVPKAADPIGWAHHLNNACLLFGISREAAVLAEFLAQCAHESNSFNQLAENLNYTAERLVAVWPKRFPTVAAASKYARNSVGLANHVYAGRMGNGSEKSGDGWRFRGRGIIMVTGRANYEAVARSTGLADLLTRPEQLEAPTGAALAAAAWWSANPRLRELARDEPMDDDEADFLAITRIVNGGVHGLADRRGFRDAFRRVLGA